VTAQEADQEAYDVNQRLALICIDDADRRAEVSAAVQELGYRPKFGEHATQILDRIRKNSYGLVVVDEAFQGATPQDHPVLRHLQWMPMTLRRYMFVALLGPGLKTYDNMTAFSRSVNVAVNYNDVAQIKAILQRGIAENDQFYRVLREVLQEVGKR
jgi:hypothetical protein